MKSSILKTGILALVLFAFSQTSSAQTGTSFDNWDPNGDGYATLTEITNYLRSGPYGHAYTDEVLNHILNSHDTDSDGVISYEEWLVEKTRVQ